MKDLDTMTVSKKSARGRFPNGGGDAFGAVPAGEWVKFVPRRDSQNSIIQTPKPGR